VSHGVPVYSPKYSVSTWFYVYLLILRKLSTCCLVLDRLSWQHYSETAQGLDSVSLAVEALCRTESTMRLACIYSFDTFVPLGQKRVLICTVKECGIICVTIQKMHDRMYGRYVGQPQSVLYVRKLVLIRKLFY